MKYLQDKEYFPFKTVIIDDSLQITLVEKKIIWNLFDFITCTAIVLNFMEAIYFSNKYSIWTRGGRHQKALMNPKHLIHS